MLEKEVRFGGRDMWKIFRDENFQNNLLAGVLGGFISGMFLLLGIFITDILNQNKNILIIYLSTYFAIWDLEIWSFGFGIWNLFVVPHKNICLNFLQYVKFIIFNTTG